MASYRDRTAMFLSTLALVGALGSPSLAAEAPPMPIRIENICPADDCFFGTWTVARPITAFAAEGDTKRAVFKLAPGEQFMAMTGHLHVLEASKAQITETFSDPPDSKNPFYQFYAGNFVFILAPRGNGFYDVWYNGRRRGASFPMAPAKFHMPGRDRVKVLKEGKWLWWVMAKNKAGKIGWLRFPGIVTGEIVELKKKRKGSWKIQPVQPLQTDPDD